MKVPKEFWKKHWPSEYEDMPCNTAIAEPIKPLRDVVEGDEIYNPSVNHPKHYNHGSIEAIDVIEDWNLDFHCGNVIKYIARHKHKEKSPQDIKKAIWYLERYLTIIED